MKLTEYRYNKENGKMMGSSQCPDCMTYAYKGIFPLKRKDIVDKIKEVTKSDKFKTKFIYSNGDTFLANQILRASRKDIINEFFDGDEVFYKFTRKELFEIFILTHPEHVIVRSRKQGLKSLRESIVKKCWVLILEDSTFKPLSSATESGKLLSPLIYYVYCRASIRTKWSLV